MRESRPGTRPDYSANLLDKLGSLVRAQYRPPRKPRKRGDFAFSGGNGVEAGLAKCSHRT